MILHYLSYYRWLVSAWILFIALLLGACASSFHKQADRAEGVIPTEQCTGNVYFENYGCSVVRLRQAAYGGNLDAQYALGYIYYYGIGTTQDFQKARKWITRAAEQGQPLAVQAGLLLRRSGSFSPDSPVVVPRDSAARHRATNQRANRRRSPSARRRRPAQSSPRQRPAARSAPRANVEALNRARPDQPLNTLLPNYGQAKEQNGGVSQEGQMKKEERTAPDRDSSAAPPLAQHDYHDMRLLPGAAPITQTEG